MVHFEIYMDLCRKKMNTVPFQEEYFYYTVEDAKDEKKLRISWEINKKCTLNLLSLLYKSFYLFMFISI